MSDKINRLLPSSPESELGLLASYFHAPKAVGALCAQRKATPELFSTPQNALVFETLAEMWAEGAPEIEALAVARRLRAAGRLEEIGGFPAITNIMLGSPTAINAAAHLDAIMETAAARRMMMAALSIAETGYTAKDLPAFIAESQAAVAEISVHAASKRQTVRQLLIEIVEDIETGKVQADVLSGIQSLDALVKMQRGNFIVIAGEAKSGKTILAGNIACHASIRQGLRTVYFSLEMTAKELVRRFVASEGRINLEMLASTLSEREFASITRGNAIVSQANLEAVADAYDLGSIIATARQLHAGSPIGLVVLDYIQLVEAGTSKRGESRQEVVAQISRSMKRLAVELNCVVIGLSQLNDDGKLRESRAIGQDANAVVVVEKTKEGGRQLYVAAQRSGPSGVAADVQWLPQFTRFEDVL